MNGPPDRALVAYMNPRRRGVSAAEWVYLGALLGLIVVFGGLLLAAWWSV